jgi:hypothetical protein
MITATRTNVPTGQVWPARTLALISAVFAAGFIVDGLFGMMIPELAYDGRPVVWDAVLRAVLHLGQIAAASAIGTAGLAGSGLTARIGLPLWIVAPRPADIAFQVGSVAILVGMVLAGVGVLRTGRWTGPGRFLPLTTGLYVIPLTGVIIAGSAQLAALTGYSVLWLLLGLSLYSVTRAGPPAPGTDDRPDLG